jgi:hypothetical protein
LIITTAPKIRSTYNLRPEQSSVQAGPMSSPALPSRSTADNIRYFAQLVAGRGPAWRVDAIPEKRAWVSRGDLRPCWWSFRDRMAKKGLVLEEMHDRSAGTILEKLNLQRYRNPRSLDPVDEAKLGDIKQSLSPGMFIDDENPYGPTLGYLFAQWQREGLDFTACCHRMIDWAIAPPKSIADLEALEAMAPQHPLAPYFDREAVFEPVKDLAKPWAAEVGGARWELALNDFPEEFLFTLLVDGQPAGILNDLPSTWKRAGDKRKKPYFPPWGPQPEPVRIVVDAATWRERYEHDQCESVWKEIQALGDRVREPDYAAPLAELVDLFLCRSASNLETLIDRLRNEGFRFLGDDQVTDPPWQKPTERTIQWLEEFEGNGGRLPLVLRAWCERIGMVSFIGMHPVLCPVSDDPFATIARYADPMQVFGPESNWPHAVGGSGIESLELGYSKRVKALKADQDGGTEIRLPQDGGDCKMTELDRSEENGFWFSEYIRECFRWGGFPGWASYRKRPQRLEDLIRKLTAGLSPV